MRLPEQWAAAAGDPGLAIWNALSVSTIYDGVARAARDWLAGYLNDRVPSTLGASLATLPRVQEKFGEIEALLQVNATLIRDAAARYDAGDPPGAVAVNRIKYVATANAVRAVEIGLELTGNPGLSRKGIAVTCDSRRLHEVRICMSKDLRFRDCADVDRRTCRRERLVMPPMRGGPAGN